MKRYYLNQVPICVSDVDFIIQDLHQDFDIDCIDETPIVVNNINNQSSDFCDAECKYSKEESQLSYKNLNFSNLPVVVYSYFSVYVEQSCDVIYFPKIGSSQRLWINGKFMLVCESSSRTIYPIHLYKGDNIVCIEHPNPSNNDRFLIRLEKINMGSSETNSLVANNYNYRGEMGNVRIKVETLFLYNNKPLEGRLFPEDYVNLDTLAPVHIFVTEKEKNIVLLEYSCNLFEKFSLDFSNIANHDEDKYNSLWVHFEFELIDGTKKVITIPIFRYETLPEATVDIVTRSKELLLKEDVPNIIKSTISYYISIIETLSRDVYYGAYLREILEYYENDKITDYIYSYKPRKLYFRSDIDGAYYSYVVTLPYDYDPNKKYPALIVLSTCELGSLTFYLQKHPGIIYFEICGRGITMGSYIGEISFFESLNEVEKTYKIDEKRVFLTGHSNGAAAAFTYAQKYPHLFAGIYPSAGMVNPSEIMNLHNTRVRYLTSPFDSFHKSTVLAQQENYEKYLLDYRCYSVDMLMHGSIPLAQYTKPVLDELFSTKLQQFPNEIYYHTDRNRHLKAYWIELHGIMYGMSYAEVYAKVSEDTIYVKICNSIGVTIRIPPQVKKDNLKIKINDKLVYSGNFKGDSISFIYSSNHFILSDGKNDDITPIYKGNGILDVYVSPMRIINCTNDDNWNSVAENLSSPITYGFVKEIDVNYPIYNEHQIDDSILQNALIILDDLSSDNEIIETVRMCAKIKVFSEGYTYKNTKYIGDYLIMQIMQNPWNSNRSILLINCNSTSLLNKNMFTRKLILPAYTNGFHTYLNSCAVIYNGEYKRILDYECDIENVTPKKIKTIQ